MYSFRTNRVCRDTGSEFPIFQAPITKLSRARWVGALSAAGGMGLMETAFADSSVLREESNTIRQLTNHPFGYHLLADLLSQRPDHEDDVMSWLVQTEPPFVTIGMGRLWSRDRDCWRHVKPLKDVGAKVYFVVETIEEALRSQDAGVDGLILAGAEAGGIRGDHDLHIFAFLQQVRRRIDLPLVASGGIVDGYGMAGAFALGAEGVLMGTRFIASLECPVHDGYKRAIAEAEKVVYADFGQPGAKMLAIRNAYSEAVLRGEISGDGTNPYIGNPLKVYLEGRTDLAMAGVGESAALFHDIKPVAEIVDDTVRTFWMEMERLSALLAPEAAEWQAAARRLQ